jgi:DNA mismatch repair protein PMS2
MQHRHTLALNGFDIIVNEAQPASYRVSLLTLPVVRQCQFDEQDLEELLFLLEDTCPSEDIIYCSKIRRVLASKACRTSWMIGDVLTQKQMQSVRPWSYFFALNFAQIVSHLSELEQPWVCPSNVIKWCIRSDRIVRMEDRRCVGFIASFKRHLNEFDIPSHNEVPGIMK